MEQKTNVQTEGNPWRILILFSLPLMAGNIFQQMYTVVDTAVVGKVLGVDALAALGAVDWLNWLTLGTIQGFTQGFSILLAQRFGAGDYGRLRQTMANAVLLSVLCAAVITAGSQALAEPVVVLLRTPEEIQPIAMAYLRLLFAGLPVVTAYNFAAAALRAHTEELLAANGRDTASAAESGMSRSLLDRLTLDEKRIEDIAAAVEEIIALPDPVGQVDQGSQRPNGLSITRIRVPLGVVGIIYEARPNVTVDAAALCVKSGNACILRGGREAIETNRALAALMDKALEEAGFPAGAVQLVTDTSRESAQEMMRANGLIDVLIPRGGAGLIKAVVENSTVPVIQTGVGNCHVYIDSPCDLAMGVRIIENAKCSRPSVCNAAETLLVHREVAEKFLPAAKEALDRHGVQLRGCPHTRRILGESVRPATEEDYAAEFGDYILAVRVVDSLPEAIAHIRKYSTGHSEAIVTSDYGHSQAFTRQVDAAAVYVNASTRFTDGGQFGLGAEIGISTQKLHARGPMGLAELTTTKYIVLGSGQIR